MSKVLTPSQVTLVAMRAKMATLKSQIKEVALDVRREKVLARQAKTDLRQVKRANAIAKAQARLEKLMAKPVGSVARKASKKPSKVVVTRMAA